MKADLVQIKMAYELFLGFKETPKDLAKVLQENGFVPDIGGYRLPGEEGTGDIRFRYWNALKDPEFWKRIDPKVKAEGELSGDAKAQENFERLVATGKVLSAHCQAILVDPTESIEDCVIQNGEE